MYWYRIATVYKTVTICNNYPCCFIKNNKDIGPVAQPVRAPAS